MRQKHVNFLLAAALCALACGANAAQAPGDQPAPEAAAPVGESQRGDALESIIAPRQDQRAAWRDYAAARADLPRRLGEAGRQAMEKAYDGQSRLEARAEMNRQRAAALDELAARRRALWQVLDPPQRLALEGWEAREGPGWRHQRPPRQGVGHGPRRAGPDCPCPWFDGPPPGASPERQPGPPPDGPRPGPRGGRS